MSKPWPAAFALLLVACGGPVASVDPTDRRPQDPAVQLMARHAAERLPWQPRLAAVSGLPWPAAIEPDIAPRAVGLRWQATRQAVTAAETLLAQLPPGTAREDLAFFVRERREELAGAAFPEELLPFSGPDGGYALWVTSALAHGQIVPETVAAHEAWLQALAFVPAWTDAAIANLGEAESRGITLAPEAWQALARRVAAAIATDLRPPTGAWGSLAPEQQQRLAERYASVAETAVRPALQRLHARLLLAAARGQRGATWHDLPLGQPWYVWRLRQATGSSRTPGEWHAAALAAIDRIELQLAGRPSPPGLRERLPPVAVPLWRRLGQYPALEEGYACHRWLDAEVLPEAVPAGLDQARQLLSLVVIDTGQHALGWNRGQAIAFLKAHTRWSDAEATHQADLVLATAGWAAAPGAGCLLLTQWQQATAARQGAAFDPEAFDHRLAAWGPLPLQELERRLQLAQVVAVAAEVPGGP